MTERFKIGVFDSGVGGLTVLAELTRQVPQAEYLYFGDTARLPYGSKSVETVARYATGAARFLQQNGIGMLVVACNTATALALDAVRDAVRVPVVGVIEPGAERALSTSRNRSVVVIGTEATVSSHAYKRALCALGLKAYEKACPLLVPLVEEGWTDHPVTEQVAHIYMGEALSQADQADVLLLGCTHYPLLKPLLRRVVPHDITIVDSAESTAAVVARKLSFGDTVPRGTPSVTCYVTDSVEKFRRLGTRFLGHELNGVQHVELGG